MRELRHDFRRFYGCRYDDVPVDEAIDLIQTLPDGSAYLAAFVPTYAWTVEEKRLADIQDYLNALMHLLSDERSTEKAERVPRPWDEWAKGMREKATDAKKRKAQRVKEKLEGTKWADVEVKPDGDDRQS